MNERKARELIEDVRKLHSPDRAPVTSELAPPELQAQSARSSVASGSKGAHLTHKNHSENFRMKTNETKFTPGPWACDHTGDRKRYIIGDNQSAWGTHVAEVYSDDTDRDEAAANAALIRKSPEMFAALAKCHAHLGKEIERKTLNESAADGTQALLAEVAALLDAVAAPSNGGSEPRAGTEK